MSNGDYNKISGKKTLILVITIITIIIALTIYSIIIMTQRSSVKTGSSYFERPTSTPTPTIFIQPIFGQ